MRGFIRSAYILSAFFLLCRPAVADDLAALRREAEAGDVQAEFMLGQRLLDGKGVPANPAQGAQWIGKAAAQGDGLSQFELATMYEFGRGLPRDHQKALVWY